MQQDRYLGDASDPLSLNRYSYCGLDPVNFVDPTGFKGEEVNKQDPSSEESGYTPPKKGDKKVKSNGKTGWLDKDGNVWVPVPTGSPQAHGGGHWDVQYPNGGYDNVYPDGHVRKGSGGRGVFSPQGARFDWNINMSPQTTTTIVVVGVTAAAILLAPETGGLSLLAL